MSIADEYIMERQGKKMALYPGLLSAAHAKGLKSIETDLVQIPSEDNGNVAIVKAEIRMEDGEKFHGIGDASPQNVGRNIAPHIIRMAETRAKARALRDAVNVAEALADDPSSGADYDQQEAAPAQRQSRQRQQQTGRRTSESQASEKSGDTSNVHNLRGAAPRKAAKVNKATLDELVDMAGELYEDEVDPRTAILDKVEEATGKRPRRLEDLSEPVAQKIKTSLQRALDEDIDEANGLGQTAAEHEEPEGEPEVDLDEEDLEEIEEISGS